MCRISNDYIGNYEIHYEQRYCIVKKKKIYIRLSGNEYESLKKMMIESEEQVIRKLDHYFYDKESKSIQRKYITKSVDIRGKKSNTCCMPIIAISIILAIMSIPFIKYGSFEGTDTLFQGFIFTFINVIVHEFGHIYFCLKSGRNINGIGVKINYIFPMVFVDTTDICMSNKLDRIKTSLGGILFNSIMGHISLIFAYVLHSDDLKVMSLISYYFVLSNLLPFLKLDGYYVVEDILGVTRLREKSVYIIKKYKLKRCKESDMIYHIYGILNLCFFIYMLLIAFFKIYDIII